MNWDELQWYCLNDNISIYNKLSHYIEYLKKQNENYVKLIIYLYENYVKEEVK